MDSSAPAPTSTRRRITGAPTPRALWRRHHLIAAIGALLAALAWGAGREPRPIFEAFDGNSIVAVLGFVAVWAGGLWVLRAAGMSSRPVFGWAISVGVVFAIAELAGLSLLRDEADLSLLAPSAWSGIHVVGTAYAAVLLVAAILILVDRLGEDRAVSNTPRTRLGRFVARLGGRTGRRRWAAIGITAGVVIVARLPVLFVWWPGLIFFDSYRSLSYARGIGPWEAYEPVGHSLIIAGWNGLWEFFGWSDQTALAFAATVQLLSSTAAFVFLLVRLAAWRVNPIVWAAALAWVSLHPVLALSSITIVKDIPFMSAFIVFAVAIAEAALRRRDERVPAWVWCTMAVAGIAVAVLRSNGVYVVILSLPLLFLPLRRHWKPMLGVASCCAIAIVAYLGPLQTALGVVPGPKTEMWSIPLQQIARIALDHHDEMSDEDREYVDSIFTSWDVDEVGDHYISEFSDPIKLDARDKWDDFTTAEFLSGWARLVGEYPMTAVTATLGNTVGYWAPGAPSYDGLVAESHNHVRTISLDIPDREDPRTGVQAYLHDNRLVGYFNTEESLNIPVLGQAMSTGTVTWVWLLSLVVLIRARAWRLAGALVPAGVLMLTFLAGPVSGGMRYMLVFFALVPLVVGLAETSARRGNTAAAPRS
ncbi:hypothetical protein GCM10010910_14080 [Microbacterium nanhaiense]|uniref:Glycosyltransferase RgtA/B/C/D-like domain-containing protein n=1 Tax=Microbacterium nanhaiense TaxID=1301026 RepID=A0ABQ2N0X9_9MICO|nr:DUF6020 family protein [Microbacterium nanhaiense]GGO62878.1 hypothetical protein GCM10010910_14080 [Microbacterium nanhaiense]